MIRLSRSAEADLERLRDYGLAHFARPTVVAFMEALVDELLALDRRIDLARQLEGTSFRVVVLKHHVAIADISGTETTITAVFSHREDWQSTDFITRLRDP